MREMRIWLPNAAKCCKNAGKFFPDVALTWADAYWLNPAIDRGASGRAVSRYTVGGYAKGALS